MNWFMICSEYSATLKAGVICREYVSILLSVRTFANQGGTADLFLVEKRELIRP